MTIWQHILRRPPNSFPFPLPVHSHSPIISPLPSPNHPSSLLLPRLHRQITYLLLDTPHNLFFSACLKYIPALPQQSLQFLRDIPARQIRALNTIWYCEAFVDRNCVGYAVAGVEDETSGSSGRIQGEDGLDGCIEGWDVEGFEEDLGGCRAVGAGV
jgi:hypothetical protein